MSPAAFRFSKWFLFLMMGLAFSMAFHLETALAQEITGNIIGTVKDATGAVIPDANVTITNEATGISTEGKTDTSGDFLFTRVLPGTYEVKVAQQGFRTHVRKGITVSVAKYSRLDIVLELGPVTQTVMVEENVKQVETVSMQLSASLPAQQIVNLPLVGRDWIQLARTLPGVTAASADRFGLPSVSGGRTQSNNYLINGVDYNDLPLNTPQAPPSPDSIAEFRLIQNTMNPEYSRNSAATLNAITKSGTNDFHGSLFWFHRDHGLNAKDFFINKAGARKPDFTQQQYGGTVGGPIWKNHTFWFFSFQGLRAGVPQDLGLQRVPTAGERSGILPRSTALSSTRRIPFAVIGSPASTVCPNTTCPAGTTWNAAFPLVNGVITIPTQNFNPISLRILQDYPLPAPGQTSYAAVGRQVSEEAQWSLRVDQNWKNDQLYGYFFWRDNTRARPFAFTGGGVPGWGDLAEGINRQISVTEIHTFSPTSVNEFRIGFNRLRFLAVFPQHVAQPSSLGFTGINTQHGDVASAPRVTITGFASWGFSNNGPQPRVDNTWHYSDNFSKRWRGHDFKFGIDFRRGTIWNPFDFGNNGVFSFGNSTGVFASGYSLVNFLLGVPSSYSQNTGALNFARTEEYYWYFQDTYKVRPNLNIVYGFGWQIDTPYKQLDNNGVAMIAFRPGRHSTVYPTAPDGILYTGDPGIPRGTVPTRKTNIGPRLGVVWSPSAESGFWHWVTGGRGDFSIRAGVGVFYNLTEGEASLQFLGNPPLGLSSSGVSDLGGPIGTPSFANPFTTVNTGTIGSTRPATLTNKFPAATAPPVGSTTLDFSQFLPLSTSILDPNLRTPKTINFNLIIERQLKKDLLIRVGYVGAQGRNLYNTSEANPVNTVRCATIPDCVDASPFTQLSGVPGITPFNGDIYGSLGIQQSVATSHYNALQMTVEKRLSHGLFFRGNYTFSKSLDSSSGLEDSGQFQGVTPNNPRRDMGWSAFDARHIVTFTYDWQLPLPKPSNPFLKHLLRTWSISGITSFQTGFPFLVWDGSDRCLAGRFQLFYDTWCRPDVAATVQRFDPRSSQAGPTNLLFNTSAFAFAAPGQIGNTPRNPIHGPGLNNFDFAVLKDTHITETKYIQFRAEFYNLWNHPQFNNPSGRFDSGLFGQVRSARVGPRVIQMALKFYF